MHHDPFLVFVVLLLAGQFGLFTFQSFARDVPAQIVYSGRALPAHKSALARELDRIVGYTCPHTGGGSTNMVGASYPWLSANTVNFLSLQQFGGAACSWASLGDVDETDPEIAWRTLMEFGSPFLLTMDFGSPRNPPPFDLRPFADLNAIDVPVYRRALRSGRYEIVPGFRRDGLVLLRLARA